jgi:phosphate transport system substrate-binding protein
VNANNPVDDLSVDEVRDIYGGKYTNWLEVGGANRVINPITRLEGSGSQTAMESFMKGREIAPKSPFAVTGASIGFSFRYYMDGIVGNDNVKMLSLNGVYPNAENIRSGSYPVVMQFYAVYRADNENKNIQVLIDWLLSDEGQQLIEKCGYVGIR